MHSTDFEISLLLNLSLPISLTPHSTVNNQARLYITGWKCSTCNSDRNTFIKVKNMHNMDHTERDQAEGKIVCKIMCKIVKTKILRKKIHERSIYERRYMKDRFTKEDTREINLHIFCVSPTPKQTVHTAEQTKS